MNYKQFEDFYLLLLSKNSKIQCTKQGQHDAKKGIEIWKYKDNYNIGLVGDKNGLIFIDCDVDAKRNLNGLETIQKLEKILGSLPNTLTQSTPRGGKHLIFKDNGIFSVFNIFADSISITGMSLFII